MGKEIKVAVVGAAGRMSSKYLIPLLKKEDGIIYVRGYEPEGPMLKKDNDLIYADLPSFPDELITSNYRKFFDQADVVIDFSTPEGSLLALHGAADRNAGIGYICCTTGFHSSQISEIKHVVNNSDLACIVAPNMSIGINLLFGVIHKMASTLGLEYNAEIVEAHHKFKKDAPSGTAKRFGEIIANARGLNYHDVVCLGREGVIEERPDNEIGIHTLRAGKIPGMHEILFASEDETIVVTHEAGDPSVFAKGALKAAKWIHGKSGGQFYTMAQVLGLEE